ncbi:NAD(P)-dependent oxidoreductase [Pseudarthrobacter sp. LT1]|uniref:NAD-dependent epimerase/dehydratase family protein n=1 Tax=Pseudarthrobacter sp. LT1 TaxID=3111450 RepID=UPI002D78D83D|nr:NAD(P)-dependent oxidoreductase [Pseudarthrobacter sp. LT1]WRT13535.1 NAD(P)-dependent oxidoreductase [Pseudarthrobacter sp. LT1]
MKVTVIGGSGHIGSFLVPRLVQAGHEVTNISRGTSKPYTDPPAWQQVQHVTADRQAEDQDGTFPDRVAALKPDVVVDLVCFTLESAAALVQRLRGEVGHLLHCGSVWRYGQSLKLPIREGSDSAAPPFGEYGIQKNRIALMLQEETASGGLATTSLHPGHIVGPGWQPVGPLGNLDPTVWQTISAGQPLRIPGSGSELMHHVHADDVAQAFEKAIARREAATGEDFNVVAPTALTVRGYADIAAAWFGHAAVLETVPWDRFRENTSREHADASWNHLYRSQCFSIEKAASMLGYAPRYEPEEAIFESIQWLVDHEQLHVARPLGVAAG